MEAGTHSGSQVAPLAFTMGGIKKLLLLSVLALTVTAGQSAFAKPKGGERGDGDREHRHITGTAMNDLGFLAALASGVGSYLLIRRRVSRK